MGESALTSHVKSVKHKKSVEITESLNKSGAAFVRQEGTVAIKTEELPKADENNNMFVPPPPPVVTIEAKGSGTKQNLLQIDKYLSKTDTKKAEILWTLHTVCNHHSYNSNTKIEKMFRAMFPDSLIAQKFTCGERKTAYLAVFGIAAHFLENLKSSICGPYSVMFDESLNKKDQSKQMDVHLRYWCGQQVVTRYFTSEFLGHATAKDMVDHFSSGVLHSGLKPVDMVQISMDGPNVNWKFYDLIKEKLLDEYDTKLLNVGSCGLHTVHNSFKTGADATGWGVDDVLGSLYYLFKHSPARREDYMKITGSSRFPLKFVNHRWLENVPVSTRAIEIWGSIVEYVNAVETKKEYTKPSCKSFQVLKAAVKDPLRLAKFHFFKTVAELLQPFLEEFQTSSPMVCFLATSLEKTLISLLRRFVKPEVMEKVDGSGITKVNPDDKDCQLSYNKIDIGFCAEKALKQEVGKVSERQIMEFRVSCKDFLVKTSKKLLEKCPLKYSLVKNLSALDPRVMAVNQEQCRTGFRKVVNVMNSAMKIKDNDCDKVFEEFCTLLDKVPLIGNQRFSEFSAKKDSLDKFYMEILNEESYPKLRAAVRVILVICHGQADVERGFSVNKEMTVENLRQESLVAQRIICDHVNKVEGVLNVNITQQLISAVSSASAKYNQYLEQQQQKKLTAEKQLKRKSDLDAIDHLQKKKARLQEDIVLLEEKSEKLFEKAEVTRKISFVTEANVLRRGCKDKIQQVADLNIEIKQKQDELK